MHRFYTLILLAAIFGLQTRSKSLVSANNLGLAEMVENDFDPERFSPYDSSNGDDESDDESLRSMSLSKRNRQQDQVKKSETVLRFGKRNRVGSEAVLRFGRAGGQRVEPMRFGRSDQKSPTLLRFGRARPADSVLRFGRARGVDTTLRFGKK